MTNQPTDNEWIEKARKTYNEIPIGGKECKDEETAFKQAIISNIPNTNDNRIDELIEKYRLLYTLTKNPHNRGAYKQIIDDLQSLKSSPTNTDKDIDKFSGLPMVQVSPCPNCGYYSVMKDGKFVGVPPANDGVIDEDLAIGQQKAAEIIGIMLKLPIGETYHIEFPEYRIIINKTAKETKTTVEKTLIYEARVEEGKRLAKEEVQESEEWIEKTAMYIVQQYILEGDETTDRYNRLVSGVKYLITSNLPQPKQQ